MFADSRPEVISLTSVPERFCVITVNYVVTWWVGIRSYVFWLVMSYVQFLWTQRVIPSKVFRWFFPWPQSISSHTCPDQHLPEVSGWIPCKSTIFSLHNPLLSMYCALHTWATLTCFSFFGFSSIWEDCWAPPEIHLPHAMAWDSQANDLGLRAHLICLPDLRDHRPSFPDICILKQLFCIFCLWFCVLFCFLFVWGQK